MFKMRDYFALLGLEHSFDIDLGLLEKNYFALQQQLHPDRFAKGSEQERIRALQQSMEANEAYNAMKSPFKRGEYLLSLQGISIKEGSSNIKPSQQVLMDMLTLREAVDEAEHLEEVQVIAENVEAEKQQVISALSSCFAAEDYQRAAQELIRLRYLEKTQEEIKLKRRTIQAA